MNNLQERIAQIDWSHVTQQLHDHGHALVPQLLHNTETSELVDFYHQPQHFRKKIIMERYRFGLGEYQYFQYPLPAILQNIRENVYTHLAPVANTWMKVLQIPQQYPATLQQLHEQCTAAGQDLPAVLILKYGIGGHNTLHQDLYGDVYFPLQVVLFLNEDYEGGEFVLTQQTPRAQSKVTVLSPRCGDMLIFTTNFKPVKSVKGYYRAHMKHGVSEVRSGQRYALGIIFHDAKT
ncbi:hypothetical protein LX64_00162 [Chitinophaga skermanii]|uniref:Fe2OG dioxygenase domain-containing protein n=1 Tax=Chitinophaga skermanii TaxID=331697 RepID=A0A327R3C6_9BACT|nr:2OG-Fe(II) oxygenase [Chitinophaga skermanii]RAJ10558.1 hypothetical protein LX64_00162 [Chitinophaga skermanii]